MLVGLKATDTAATPQGRLWNPRHRSRALLLAALLAAVVVPSHALQVQQATPQGEVPKVRQAVVRFTAAAVRFGDAQAADPYTVRCTPQVAPGRGRWVDESSWRYDFSEALPPGVQCEMQPVPGWKPLQGTLDTAPSFNFRTGGPAIDRVSPSSGTIEEGAYFIAQLTGAAVPTTVARNAWCEVDGIGERIPVRLVEGKDRDTLLTARHLEKVADRTLVMACGRPLPADADARLVWGPGIAAAINPRVVTTVTQRFDYHVRPAFMAEFSCERERANAGCLPLRDMTVGFSAPVPREQLEALRLQPESGAAIAPRFDKDDSSKESTLVTFKSPLPENTRFTITMPAGLRDNSGRLLSNAGSFPLRVETGAIPPIAKFSAAPFGIIELGDEPTLPVTLRHVQGDMRPNAPSGRVLDKVLTSDQDILAWFKRVQDYHETQITAQQAGLPRDQWTVVESVSDGSGRTRMVKRDRMVGTRELSLLRAEPGARRLDLPQLLGGDPRPFEVVGIPLVQPGYHVVEIESARLGESLLETKAPMYVRTGVLLTNLGVHFKQGRENSLVWVTTLDKAEPVEGAQVAVNDCMGRVLHTGRTGRDGTLTVPTALPANPNACAYDKGYFVTARISGPKGSNDVSFVFSRWQKGIESWRFNVPTDMGRDTDTVAHTVFDRTLLRASETVSMKHFLRTQSLRGLGEVPAEFLPDQAKFTHGGSGQSFTVPIAWSGSRSGESTWAIPRTAKLGTYDVTLVRSKAEGRGANADGWPKTWSSGNFRVEEFRTPLLKASIEGPKGAVVAPTEVPLSAQLSYFAGGAVKSARAHVSAMLQPRVPRFEGYDDYSFQAPRAPDPSQAGPGDDDEQDDSDDAADREDRASSSRLVANRLPLNTDQAGSGKVTVSGVPPITEPADLLAELTFNDPNGEAQTVSTRVALWPSAVVLGVRVGSWASSRGRAKFQVLALDTMGKPIAGQNVEVKGRRTRYISTRKRMVGGFYAYDNRREVDELGTLCQGKTDSSGVLACDAAFDSSGQVELVAQAKDAGGHLATAAASVWVVGRGELWFAQDNDDRIDLLPEKKAYEPGETARLQVRMPFRQATALVTVEREGVIERSVQALRGDAPTVDVRIPKDASAWSPNVYVSVLVLRGRIRDVPWYSLFTWGWRSPLEWARSFWYEGREYQAPTAMIDLAKPSYKLGLAPLRIGLAAHRLQVAVTTDKPQYGVRETVHARVKVTQGGKPAAGAEVAFAAVDEGLLALRDNDSWDLLDALYESRPLGVETATAQSEIVGRRHYGRKAVAAGGGGGRGQTRELFDTLLLWKGRVVLDAKGEAAVDVPLNDSLTSFRFVAVADAGVAAFGTGSASVRVTQDLQVLAGLPPLVREGDHWLASVTVRNATAREMRVSASLRGSASNGTPVPVAVEAGSREATIAAGGAAELTWPVDAPVGAQTITWEVSAKDAAGSASDLAKLTQRVVPAVPLSVQQARLLQLDQPLELAVAAPADALPIATGANSMATAPRGGIDVSAQPRLSNALPGLRRFFENYPFACIEQKTSKAIGLDDPAMWSRVAADLPGYLDSDGLASYFPPSAGDADHGSDVLTAYLLSAAQEAGLEWPAEAKQRMLDGLARFVDGRIERRMWQPPSLKVRAIDVRKLAALEALSRYGRVTPRMLGSIEVAPQVWPTSALIDWYLVLRRVPELPDRSRRLDEASQQLRSRLSYSGTALTFTTEDSDFWWWMMAGSDGNAARLVLATLDDPAWQQDVPRMVLGALARQRGGAWMTTTANLWGTLALRKFSQRFEKAPVHGQTEARLGGSAPNVIDWTRHADGGDVLLPWPAAGEGTLQVRQVGTGKPWLSVQSLAAVPLTAPLDAGYRLKRTLTGVEQRQAGAWSRGDIVRVRLEIQAGSDRTWVVASDPVPPGATILGSGLGRDSAIATREESQSTTGVQPVFVERAQEAFRGYFEEMPSGKHVLEYTIRLNTPGRFTLPPVRVEAMYAPDVAGALPGAVMEVLP